MKIKFKKGGNNSAFRKFMSLIALIVGIIMGGLLIACGIFFSFQKNVYTESATSTVTNSVCNTTPKNALVCNTTVVYTIKTQKITSNLDTGSTHYNNGDVINIYYNPSNPTNITRNPPNWQIVSLLLLIFGFIVLGGVILNYYIVYR